VVLHCNLANELMQLGDAEAALVQVDEGLARCSRLPNPRLLDTLLINRIVVLTELGRAPEALADVQAVRAIPANEQGRGRNASCFEILALAALRAGDVALGRELVAAATAHHEPIAEETHEMARACALLAAAEGHVDDALAVMAPLRDRLFDDATDDGLSMRVRSAGLQLLSELHERAGRPAAALAALCAWKSLQARRSAMASRARTQSALLQTELMRLGRQLEEQEVRRRETERARTALQAINEHLSRQMQEVQRLQDQLREQATRDLLTGLFDRRHLADVPPAMPGAPRGAAAGGGHRRPRLLQGRQRPPRPCGRRRAAGGVRPPAAGRQPRQRRHLPLGRRGVLPADAEHRRHGRRALSPAQAVGGCELSGTGGIPTFSWTPISSADADLGNPADYDFSGADTALSEIAGAGAAVYLRLGESYNGPNHTADPVAWAKVAANIYRHVIGAFKPSIGVAAVDPVYVEVHNEPDGGFWRGSAAEFHTLFRETVTRVRAVAAAAGRTVRIGGPGFTRSILTTATVAGNPANGFVGAVGADSLDFYSAHHYGSCSTATLAASASFLRSLRALVDGQGGAGKPIHVTEWNIGLGTQCGSALYAEPRMQSWTSGVLTLMQEPAYRIEAAHFYSGVPIMSLFDFTTVSG